MNQILSTKIKRKININKFFLRFQFAISIIITIVLIGLIIHYSLSLKKKEKLSSSLINNYNIYKLYAPHSAENINTKGQDNNIFGIIEIPRINIYYPIFSYLTEDLLKVSPCKFYGETLDKNGNICIAGHNYNNSMFFSNLSLLNVDDEIYIYDNSGKKYIYLVTSFYEVHESDLSPIFDYDKSLKELTLVTCNNLNSNRLIVKAKQIK